MIIGEVTCLILLVNTYKCWVIVFPPTDGLCQAVLWIWTMSNLVTTRLAHIQNVHSFSNIMPRGARCLRDITPEYSDYIIWLDSISDPCNFPKCKTSLSEEGEFFSVFVKNDKWIYYFTLSILSYKIEHLSCFVTVSLPIQKGLVLSRNCKEKIVIPVNGVGEV